MAPALAYERHEMPVSDAAALRLLAERGPFEEALVHRGSRADRSPAVVHKTPPLSDPTLCMGCGAAFSRKTWRRSSRRKARALREDYNGSDRDGQLLAVWERDEKPARRR